jgi:hypothetical protein
VPKICSLREIMPICRQNRVATPRMTLNRAVGYQPASAVTDRSAMAAHWDFAPHTVGVLLAT